MGKNVEVVIEIINAKRITVVEGQIEGFGGTVFDALLDILIRSTSRNPYLPAYNP